MGIKKLKRLADSTVKDLRQHYYFHAPKGLGADPEQCVACAHTHPELEKKIDAAAAKATQYSLYGIGFIVAANLISEGLKRRFFK